MAEPEPADLREIIPGRIYWAAVHNAGRDKTLPQDTDRVHYFSIDDELVYEPLNADFGPLNLAMVYKYCMKLRSKLLDPALAEKRIVHCCRAHDQRKRANAACLICAYQVVALGATAEKAYEPFLDIDPPFLPFRDAMSGPSDFDLTILDCLRGLKLAIENGWFDLNTFDADEYLFYNRVENGDLSWIIPGKFLAFAGPGATSTDSDGYTVFTPEQYVPIFNRGGVTRVVRLNSKEYDQHRFTVHGIKHSDLIFADGSIPPSEIVSQFLDTVEHEPSGAIAVHCKAGLGRTGTLIALYAMKHYRFPARAFIGWSRLARPGTILGPQQQFLLDMEAEMFEAGAALRSPSSPFSLSDSDASERGSPTSPTERMNLKGRRQAEEFEDQGQGERLCSAKRLHAKPELATSIASSCMRCAELSGSSLSACKCCRCRKEQIMKNMSWALTKSVEVVIEKTEDSPFSPCLKSYWRMNKRLFECLPNLA